MFVKRKEKKQKRANLALQRAIAVGEPLAPMPSREPVEVLVEKANMIVENFKRFCKNLGGQVREQKRPSVYKVSCIFPDIVGIVLNVDKRETHIEINMSGIQINNPSKRAEFHETTHTVKIEGWEAKPYDVWAMLRITPPGYSKYENFRLEGSYIREIDLETHPGEAEIKITLYGTG